MIPARKWRPPFQEDWAVNCQVLHRCIFAEGWQHTHGDLAWSGKVQWIQRIQVAETDGSYHRRTRVSLKRRGGNGAGGSREEQCSSTASRGVCKRLQKSCENWNLARKRRTLTHSSWNLVEDPWRCSDQGPEMSERSSFFFLRCSSLRDVLSCCEGNNFYPVCRLKASDVHNMMCPSEPRTPFVAGTFACRSVKC